MVIYNITNKINGKRYIGQTVGTLKRRWRAHCSVSSKCPFIRNAIQKYGVENFTIETLIKCGSVEEMNYWESHYIALLNTLSPFGYNLNTGGEHRRASEYSKKRTSAANKGRICSAEVKRKISEAQKGSKNHNFGKKTSEETKIKMSEAQSGKNNHNYGKEHTVESKQKISLNQKKQNLKETSVLKKTIICNQTGTSYVSIRDAGRKLSVNPSGIVKVLKGTRKSIDGLTFCYA